MKFNCSFKTLFTDTSLSKSRCPEIVPHVPFCWLKHIVLASKEKRAKGKFAPPLNKYLAWSSSWLQTFHFPMKLSMPRGSVPHRMISLFLRILEGKDHPSSIFFPARLFYSWTLYEFGGVFVEGSAEKWDPRHCFCRRKHRGFLFI